MVRRWLYHWGGQWTHAIKKKKKWKVHHGYLKIKIENLSIQCVTLVAWKYITLNLGDILYFSDQYLIFNYCIFRREWGHNYYSSRLCWPGFRVTDLSTCSTFLHLTELIWILFNPTTDPSRGFELDMFYQRSNLTVQHKCMHWSRELKNK